MRRGGDGDVLQDEFKGGGEGEIYTCAAFRMDWNPEPQSRFTVRAGTGMGIPAFRPTWRAR